MFRSVVKVPKTHRSKNKIKSTMSVKIREKEHHGSSGTQISSYSSSDNLEGGVGGEEIQCNFLPWIGMKLTQLWFWVTQAWNYCVLQTDLSCNEFRRQSTCYNKVYIKTTEEYIPKTHKFFCGSCDLSFFWVVLKNSYTNWTFFKFSFLLGVFFFFWLLDTTAIYFNGNEAQNVSELNHVLRKLCVLLLSTAFFGSITFTIYLVEYMNMFSLNESKGNVGKEHDDTVVLKEIKEKLREEEDEEEEEEEEVEEGEEGESEFYISLH